MRDEVLASTDFIVGTQKYLPMLSSICKNVHRFVEALQKVLAKGSGAAQKGIRCCVLLNSSAGHQVSDITEGRIRYVHAAK